jgi:hypothetical protein
MNEYRLGINHTNSSLYLCVCVFLYNQNIYIIMLVLSTLYSLTYVSMHHTPCDTHTHIQTHNTHTCTRTHSLHLRSLSHTQTHTHTHTSMWSGDAGAYALCRAMQENSSLIDLYLSHNNGSPPMLASLSLSLSLSLVLYLSLFLFLSLSLSLIHYNHVCVDRLHQRALL